MGTVLSAKLAVFIELNLHASLVVNTDRAQIACPSVVQNTLHILGLSCFIVK